MDMGVRNDNSIIIFFVSEEAGNRDIVAVHDPIEDVFCLFEIFPFQSRLGEHNQLLLHQLKTMSLESRVKKKLPIGFEERRTSIDLSTFTSHMSCSGFWEKDTCVSSLVVLSDGA